MAEEIQIQGSAYRGKVRNPLGIIGLAIITLGIYSFVWYYKTNKELAEVGQARGTEECGTNPLMSLLAYFPGSFVVIPPLVSSFRFCKRLSAAERVTGTAGGMEPVLLWLLWFSSYFIVITGPIAAYIAQTNLNKVLENQARGASAPPLQAPEQPAGAEQPAAAAEQPASSSQPPQSPQSP